LWPEGSSPSNPSGEQREYFSPTINKYLDSNLLSVEGSMIDSVLNVAVFAALILCIVGFSARAKSSKT
jgi:hypothetical protein